MVLHPHAEAFESPPQLVAPGVGVGNAGSLNQCQPIAPVNALRSANGRPVVKRRGQGQCRRRRASLDLGPRLGRFQAAEVDLGLAEGLGVVVVRDRAVRVVGLRRADSDHAIEQRLVALGRVQPGLDLRAQGQQTGRGAKIAGGFRLFDSGQCHLPPREVLGVGTGLLEERVRPAHDPVARRLPLDALPDLFGPLLEVIRRAQTARIVRASTDAASASCTLRRRLSSIACATATARSRSAACTRSWTPAR